MVTIRETYTLLMTRTLVLALSAAIPAVTAAEEVAKRPQWWEIATGVLAIPAAMLGLVYSVVLIRKTRIEVKKTQLEIEEKEAALHKTAAASAEVVHTLIPPLVESKQVQLLVLRFVLLWVTFEFWRFFGNVFNFLLTGLYIGLQQFVSGDESKGVGGAILFVLLINLPKLGEFLLLAGLGLPLFRDVTTVLHVDLRSVLFFWRRKAG